MCITPPAHLSAVGAVHCLAPPTRASHPPLTASAHGGEEDQIRRRSDPMSLDRVTCFHDPAWCQPRLNRPEGFRASQPGPNGPQGLSRIPRIPRISGNSRPAGAVARPAGIPVHEGCRDGAVRPPRYFAPEVPPKRSVRPNCRQAKEESESIKKSMKMKKFRSDSSVRAHGSRACRRLRPCPRRLGCARHQLRACPRRLRRAG